MELKVSRVLHAGYIFDNNKDKIIFDPIFENPFSHNCYAFPSVEFNIDKIKKINWSAVFISHIHDDHLSLESLNLIEKETPIYLYSIHEELFTLITALGFLHVYPLHIDKTVTIGEFQVTPRKALDPDVDTIFHIEVSGLNILNVVDAWIDPLALDKLLEHAQWDLVLWPFQTLCELEVLSPTRAEPAARSIPDEWIQQIKLLNPRFIIPSSCQFIHESWSWYNFALFPITYRQFTDQINTEIPTAKVIKLDPSCTIILTKAELKKGSDLAWVDLEKNPVSDYEFNPDFKPSSTAEIASHFKKLTTPQKSSVIDYCRKNLVEKYNLLDSPEENYFLKSGFWQLSLFDKDGIPEIILYHFTKGRIELAAPSSTSKLIWLTELPIFKLYSALNSGESFTSMYVRINDTKFEAEIEAELATVDILLDPLARCLFSSGVGSFQAAQLKKLLSASKNV